MGKVLKVELTVPPLEFVHPFRNFGEAVYLDLRNECEVSLDEIDRATNVFYVRGLKSKFVRSAVARVRKIAAAQQMAGMIDVTEI